MSMSECVSRYNVSDLAYFNIPKSCYYTNKNSIILLYKNSTEYQIL